MGSANRERLLYGPQIASRLSHGSFIGRPTQSLITIPVKSTAVFRQANERGSLQRASLECHRKSLMHSSFATTGLIAQLGQAKCVRWQL